VPSDVARHFASARGVTDQRDILEIKRLDESCQIVGVPIHVIPGPSLTGSAVAAPVMCDHAESILGEEQHLAVPCVRIQRPSV